MDWPQFELIASVYIRKSVSVRLIEIDILLKRVCAWCISSVESAKSC